MIIQKFNQEDEDFWRLMGRYFASAKIKRDLGISMSSDESYVWFLALDKGSVVGFCAIVPSKSCCELKHDYVFSDRGGATHQKVVSEALKYAIKTKSLDKPIKSTVRFSELSFYETLGFLKVSDKGQYVVVAHS
jgi:hypothetical protein